MFKEYHLPSLYKSKHQKVINIAHRGASGYCPENTLASFKKAVEMDADMIELDVLLSKDGVPMVTHYIKLNKCTNGSGLITTHSLKELKKLDAGSWFDTTFSDQKIPTLKEVLDYISGKISLNIEIKKQKTGFPRGYVERQCLELVEEFGMKGYVIVSSFDYQVIEQIKKLDADIPLALLYDRPQSNHLLPHDLVKKYHADAFNCSYHELTKKRKKSLQENGIPSFIYTVNDEHKMRKLIDFGVTGLFTDKPDLLKRVLESYDS